MITPILKHHSAASLIRQINHVKTIRSGKVQDVASSLEKDLIAHLTQTQALGEALDALQIDSLALMVLRRDTLKSICLKLLVGYIPKHPDTKVDVISELVERFGEDLVVSSIITTNPDDAMGVELMPVLHEYWLSKSKTPVDLMKEFKEVKHWEKSGSFATQTLDAWFSYMDYIVEKKLTSIEYLLKYLENILPPEALSSFFLKAEKCPSMRGAMKQSPETMFKVLGLAENHEAVIKHPRFPIWLAYKQSYDGRYPRHKKSLAAIFADHFGSDRVQQLVDKLQEVLEDKQTPLVRAGLLSLDDLSLGSSREPED